MRYILLPALLAVTFHLPAQRLSLDSMRTELVEWERLSKGKGDTVGIDLMTNLTVMYMMRGWVDSLLIMSDRTVEVAGKAVDEALGTSAEKVLRERYGVALDLDMGARVSASDPVRGVERARIALANATTLGNLSFERNATYMMSQFYWDLGFDSLALVWYDRYERLPNDENSMGPAAAKVYQANILHNLGRKDTALFILRDALRLNDPQRSVVTHMEIYAALANIYLHRGAIDSVEHYVNAGRKLLKEVHGAAAFHSWGLVEAQLDILHNEPLLALRRASAMDSIGRAIRDYSLSGRALRYQVVAQALLGKAREALQSTYTMEANVRREYDVERMRKLALAQSEMAHENELKLRAAEISAREKDRDLALAGLGAVVLVALLLGLLVFQARRSAVRLRTANSELVSTQGRLVQVEHERATEAVRTRIARDIHDDLGAELTRLSMISDELRKEGSLRPAEEPLIGSIAEGARRINHLMSDVVWAVDPGADTARDLVERVRSTAQRLLENTHVELRVDLTAADPELTLKPEVKRDLQLLVKEAINNALKYASARTMELVLRLRPDGFHFSLKDDGVGIKGAGHGGHGLANMQARALRLGGTLSIQTPNGGGTLVEANGSFSAARN